jgi:hypothetical protein
MAVRLDSLTYGRLLSRQQNMDRDASGGYAQNMPPEPNQSFVHSSIPFDANRIGAAAVYCSDGRFGEQVDELLFKTLKLPRYDRLAVPGDRLSVLRSQRRSVRQPQHHHWDIYCSFGN